MGIWVLIRKKYWKNLLYPINPLLNAGYYLPLQYFPLPMVFPWQIHFPSSHVARELQSLLALQWCKGAKKANVTLESLWIEKFKFQKCYYFTKLHSWPNVLRHYFRDSSGPTPHLREKSIYSLPPPSPLTMLSIRQEFCPQIIIGEVVIAKMKLIS